MTRSLLDVLQLAASGETVDIGDHALAGVTGHDLAFALDLGWASIPPDVAGHLTPPGELLGDLDVTAGDVLAAVLRDPEPLSIDDLDNRWGEGSDAAEPTLAPIGEQPSAANLPWDQHDDLGFDGTLDAVLDDGEEFPAEPIDGDDHGADPDADSDPWDDFFE